MIRGSIRVWHEGLIYKLKSNGTADFLGIMNEFLAIRYQRVAPNGQISKCTQQIPEFHRVYLNYGDIIREYAFNKSFQERLETIEYSAITGALRDKTKEKIYQELGLQSLYHRRWFWKLSHFYKIYKNQYLLIYLKYYPKAADVIKHISPV